MLSRAEQNWHTEWLLIQPRRAVENSNGCRWRKVWQAISRAIWQRYTRRAPHAAGVWSQRRAVGRYSSRSHKTSPTPPDLRLTPLLTSASIFSIASFPRIFLYFFSSFFCLSFFGLSQSSVTGFPQFIYLVFDSSSFSVDLSIAHPAGSDIHRILLILLHSSIITSSYYNAFHQLIDHRHGVLPLHILRPVSSQTPTILARQGQQW